MTRLDCKGFVFPPSDWSKRRFEKPVDFRKAHFFGPLNSRNADFVGEVLFSGATFDEKADWRLLLDRAIEIHLNYHCAEHRIRRGRQQLSGDDLCLAQRQTSRISMARRSTTTSLSPGRSPNSQSLPRCGINFAELCALPLRWKIHSRETEQVQGKR